MCNRHKLSDNTPFFGKTKLIITTNYLNEDLLVFLWPC